MSALRERMRMRCHASRDAPQRIARPDAPAPLATSVAGGGASMVPSVSNVLNPAWIAAIGTALSTLIAATVLLRDQEDRQRRQVEGVASSAEADVDNGAPLFKVAVTNASQLPLPIVFVTVESEFMASDGGFTIVLSGQAEFFDLPSGTTTGAAAVLQPVRPIYSHATWHPAAVTAIRVVDIAGRRWVRVTGDSWRRYRQSPIGWIFSKYQLFRLRRVRLPGRLTPGASSSHGSKNDGFGGGGLEGAWRQVAGAI